MRAPDTNPICVYVYMVNCPEAAHEYNGGPEYTAYFQNYVTRLCVYGKWPRGGPEYNGGPDYTQPTFSYDADRPFTRE